MRFICEWLISRLSRSVCNVRGLMRHCPQTSSPVSHLSMRPVSLLRLRAATFSESAPNAATIISKVFFSIDTISIFMSFRVCRKGNETAYKTYRFPLKGCLLRRLTGLRSHLPQKSYVSHVVSC